VSSIRPTNIAKASSRKAAIGISQTAAKERARIRPATAIALEAREPAVRIASVRSRR
jgi:hypothetical protein